DRDRWPRPTGRLRHRAAPGRGAGADHADRHGHGHVALHGAGAARRAGGWSASGSLWVGRPAVRDAHQASAAPRCLAGGPIARALIAAAAVLVLAVALSGSLKVASAEPTPLATPFATPLPAWATQLADKQSAACGEGPSAAELAAMGRAAATEEVNSAIADC